VHFCHVIVKNEPTFNDYPCDLTIAHALIFDRKANGATLTKFSKTKKRENGCNSSLFHAFSVDVVLSI
jgi:hypothetical protein